MARNPTLTLTQRYLLGIAVARAVAMVVGGLEIRHEMHEWALQQARSEARLVVDRSLATHQFFTGQLKPAVSKLLASSNLGPDYFDPVWMSSTHAVREIHRLFQQGRSGEYLYKECAIGARNPANEADEHERRFLEELNLNPEVVDRAQIRNIDGRDYFTLLRRGEVLEAGCLRCHSTPEAAPGGLLERYGARRGFHRRVGEVISALSVRVPVSDVLSPASHGTIRLTVALAAIFLALALVMAWSSRVLVLVPLRRLRDAVLRLAGHAELLGEQLPEPSGRELADLTHAFNTLSAGLKDSHERLEERVRERTAELTAANERLAAETEERRRTEAEKTELIAQLQKSLSEIRTLRGIIPICAGCKKIRDDAGAWRQLEVYIRQHSEADFSHGMCPECVRKYYPEDEG